jgi:hypothetical protein
LKNEQETRGKGERHGLYFLESCIHLPWQTQNSQNVSTQNAVQKCNGSSNG